VFHAHALVPVDRVDDGAGRRAQRLLAGQPVNRWARVLLAMMMNVDFHSSIFFF
jgi:hypothetical protein